MKPEAELLYITAALRGRARLYWLNVLCKLVLGVPLMFIGPAVFATLAWFCAGEVFHVYLAWGWVFAAFTALLLPLLFRLELRTGGGFLADAVRGIEPLSEGWGVLTRPIPGYRGAMRIVHDPRGGVAGAVEIFLTGPRLILEAVRAARTRTRLGTVALPEAARVLQDLYAAEGGIETAELARRAPGPRTFDRAVFWLMLHDWIGLTEEGERVYLYTAARAALTRALWNWRGRAAG